MTRQANMPTKPLVNEFSWSKSREGTFSECKRRYWFTYYGSWSGWEPEADPRTREIYVLKQLVNRWIWIGQVVHEAIERSLKNHRASQKPLALDVDDIVAITVQQMRQDFKDSRAGLYRMKPKSRGLIEHEHRQPVANEEWRKAAATVERCLRNFYASDIYRALLAVPREDWLEIEELSSFELDGIKIIVVLDFSYRAGDEVVILDWKTGASDETINRFQLACYTLYAGKRWGSPPGRVRAIEFNLNRNQVIEHRLTAEDIERTLGVIQGSVADMKRMLRDPERNIAVEEDFPRINEARICRRCNFFSVCEPDLPASTGGSGPPLRPRLPADHS
jgi:CRISPR/Cas system-associated exonuclease Cas4 (RecB family)